MAIPFLSDIKLNGNQIKELVVDHKSGSNPTGGYHGQLIFRTDENKIYINTSTNVNSASWSSIAGDITAITAGNGLTGDATTGDVTINVGASKGITVSSNRVSVDVDASTIDFTTSTDAAKIKIKDGGVDTTQLAGDAVTSAKIADNAINSEHYTDGSIDHVHLAADAVDGDNIADDSINSEHIAAGAIDTEHIADQQVTLAELVQIQSPGFIGRATSGTGVIEAMTTGTARSILNVADGATATAAPAIVDSSGTPAFASGITKAEVQSLLNVADGAGANVATNISVTENNTTVTIASSTGSNDTIAAATQSKAGVMTKDDKAKLDGISAGAGAPTFTNIKSALQTMDENDDLVIGDSGEDTQVTIKGNLTVTGTQTVNNVVTVSTSNGVQFEGAAADGHDAILKSSVASSDKTYTLPNLTGHIPLLAVAPTATISATPAELNVLDGFAGVTADLTYAKDLRATGVTTTEFNKLDGLTATTTELNYVDGVTSAIQTQINGKQGTISGAATTITGSNLTASRALISNGSGKVAVASITKTELEYLDGVTSAIQTQINSKQATITGAATTIDDSNLTASRALISNGSGKVAVSAVTSTELAHLDGVTSAIQNQLNGKESASNKVTKKLSGDGSSTTYTITHSFGTPIVGVKVLDYANNGSSATYQEVNVHIDRNDDNSVDINFGSAPSSTQDYLILIEKYPAIS